MEKLNKIIEILNSYESEHYQDTGRIDRTMTDLIHSEIERAISRIADSISFEFKAGEYQNQEIRELERQRDYLKSKLEENKIKF